MGLPIFASSKDLECVATNGVFSNYGHKNDSGMLISLRALQLGVGVPEKKFSYLCVGRGSRNFTTSADIMRFGLLSDAPDYRIYPESTLVLSVSDGIRDDVIVNTNGTQGCESYLHLPTQAASASDVLCTAEGTQHMCSPKSGWSALSMITLAI